jgi:hypothetical protein
MAGKLIPTKTFKVTFQKRKVEPAFSIRSMASLLRAKDFVQRRGIKVSIRRRLRYGS